ncbi:hypothetical protein QMK33_16665 [Hymenobacter sp. H14-R3]|uniref:hypothetical protein n=1 Tax=Hymenobacter sp. H14-R3 TaxID=3046308 RepID=UPI0024B9E22A|nr:hypothetical protein [Hymenobacter sp. H14-R3]MDJ0366788.1 hypothetical protein [Hymenobacter sp. H14-R3]
MSYTESQICLGQAEVALSHGQYQQAAGQYAAVVTGLEPAASPGRPLTPQAALLVRHYATASRGQSAALARLGEMPAAEGTLLTALTRLRGCISNLGTPAAERAPLLTEYKLCFYALADCYFASQQADKLAAYVHRHAPEIQRWAQDLHLVRADAASN